MPLPQQGQAGVPASQGHTRLFPHVIVAVLILLAWPYPFVPFCLRGRACLLSAFIVCSSRLCCYCLYLNIDMSSMGMLCHEAWRHEMRTQIAAVHALLQKPSCQTCKISLCASIAGTAHKQVLGIHQLGTSLSSAVIQACMHMYKRGTQ